MIHHPDDQYGQHLDALADEVADNYEHDRKIFIERMGTGTRLCSALYDGLDEALYDFFEGWWQKNKREG